MTVRDILTLALALTALACLPLIAGNAAINFMIATLIITLSAQGWNILAGYTGQYSFGHAAFFGTGAYSTAILQTAFGINAWIGFAAGIALAALAGAIIGTLAFRSGLRGSYFALVTLAFAEVFRILANAAPITGGAAGTLVKLDVGAATLQFADRVHFYWFALALVGFVLIMTRMIERRRLGAYMIAVRENEQAASALGVDALWIKLVAITLSAAVTGAAGCLYVQYFLYIDATLAYGASVSVEALVAPIVGGAGTVFGPLVGALALHGVGEVTKMIAGRIPGIDLVAFGIVLVGTIAFAPRGVVGLFDWRRWRGVRGVRTS